MTDLGIRHDPVSRRFEAVADGHLCLLDYRLSGGRMSIQHTEVPSAVGGRGIAAALVRAAADWARDGNLRVVPACSYAAAYFERHREYDDIVDPA